MQLEIHTEIKNKLKYFHSIHKIPNIIFNGPSGSGKSTIVNEFISLIYNGDKEQIKNFVMYVNCAHGKGIKFVREELKFFAKTHINSNGGNIFKSIVLFNGDKLTMDAQSALRRCIELFSHSTRFFIIVENKYNLLRPILSRFCEIYIPEPTLNNRPVNLYIHNLEQTYQLTSLKKTRDDWLKKEIKKCINLNTTDIDVQIFVNKLYEKAYSALDILKLIENNEFRLNDEKKYELLVAFNKIRKEIRNEKLLMNFIIHFIFIDTNTCLDNLSFI
jgi:DNA polymerase III delta prime subunit